MEDAVKNFFKKSVFLKPLCIVAFTLLILTDQQTGITTAIVVAFSVLLLIEGVLALKFTKPSLEIGLQKIQASDLSNVEKTKRETALIKADKVLAVCNIVAAVAIPFIWFVIL